MSILNHSDLTSDITTYIKNNGAQQITGDILQERLLNLGDSAINKLGDTGIAGILRYGSIFSIANSGDIVHKQYVDDSIAAIDLSAYLQKSLSSGNIFVGDVSNNAAGVTLQLNPSPGAFGLSNTGVLTIPDASGSTRGLLNSTDWNTFNNKYNLPALTAGSVLFSNGTTIAQDNSNLFWDNTNKRLGIGTGSPTSILHVSGSLTGANNATGIIGSNFNNTITLTGTNTAKIAYGSSFTPTLVASANSDVLHGMIINPTFTNGAFLSVPNVALTVNGYLQLGTSNDTFLFRGAANRIEVRNNATGAGTYSDFGARNFMVNGSAGAIIGNTSGINMDINSGGGSTNATALRIGNTTGLISTSSIVQAISVIGMFGNNITSSGELIGAGFGQQYNISLGTFTGRISAVKISPNFSNVNSATAVNIIDIGTNTSSGLSGTHTSYLSINSAGSITINGLSYHSNIAAGSNRIDSFQIYAGDIVAGNSAPFFQTENGQVIKLYQVNSGSAYSITNGTTDRTYDADATTVSELADIIYTLIQDLKLTGILS